MQQLIKYLLCKDQHSQSSSWTHWVDKLKASLIWRLLYVEISETGLQNSAFLKDENSLKVLWEKWKLSEDGARFPSNGQNVDFPQISILAVNSSQYDDREC